MRNIKYNIYNEDGKNAMDLTVSLYELECSWSRILNVGSKQLVSVLMIIYLAFTIRTLLLDSINFHFDIWTRVPC
jgi:beta-glucosidase/6-phospho-beta-glucosidase/beta-galactosidase